LFGNDLPSSANKQPQ